MLFRSYAEYERPGDYTFLPYYIEERSDYTIGRQDTNAICYPNRTVSRVHARLHWTGRSWAVIDENSVNGVYVNNRRVRSAELRVGDAVYLMGLYILIGTGFIAINNANDRVTFHTPKIRPVQGERDLIYPKPPQAPSGGETYDRQPRMLTELDPEPISSSEFPVRIS